MNLREKAAELAKTTQCNCDLDNWEPEASTGHSHVCRIHRAAVGLAPMADRRTAAERAYDNYVTRVHYPNDADE